MVLTTDALQKQEIIVNKTQTLFPNLRVCYLKSIMKLLHGKKIVIPSIDSIKVIKRLLGHFDVIHVHGYRTILNGLVTHYAAKQGKPYVIQPHGTAPRVMSKNTIKRMYDIFVGEKSITKASRILALNEFETNQLIDLGFSKKKIKKIPNGVNLADFVNLPVSRDFRSKYDINDRDRIILFLGRIHKYKGISTLIKAYNRLIMNQNFLDTTLILAGPDDGYLNSAKRLANSLGLNDRIIFTGFLNETEKINALSASDIFAIASIYEIFPMSLLEAFACEIPVIASSVGGIKELVQHKKTGLLFQPNDINGLTDSLSLLLSDYRFRKQLGRNGKLFLKNNLTINHVVNQLKQLYLQVARD